MQEGWNPDIYLRYKSYRARPALDLIQQIPLDVDGPIIDLGCGPGNITRLLKEKWPDHLVYGVDKSETMLAKAREAFGKSSVNWQQGDITSWRPDEEFALVFSNAALHWVENHKQIIPRLMNAITPGGYLAFQIPITEDAPYQVCIRETVFSEPWRNKLAKAWMYKNPLEPGPLYDLLTPFSKSVDIWVTDYHHVLEGESPVAEWIMGTGLTPYLAELKDSEKEEFISEYTARIIDTYPKQADGKTLFLMKRMFAIAQKN